MTWPAVVVWILILPGIFLSSPLYLLYLFFSLGVFGSLSVLPGDSVPLVPQACCGVFLFFRLCDAPAVCPYGGNHNHEL